MTVNFDKLRSLADDSPAFEIERNRIIGEYLSTLPPERRIQALTLQMQLDMKRESMTPETFLSYLVNQIDMNLKKIESLSTRARELLDGVARPENVAYLDEFKRDGVSKKSPR